MHSLKKLQSERSIFKNIIIIIIKCGQSYETRDAIKPSMKVLEKCEQVNEMKSSYFNKYMETCVQYIFNLVTIVRKFKMVPLLVKILIKQS